MRKQLVSSKIDSKEKDNRKPRNKVNKNDASINVLINLPLDNIIVDFYDIPLNVYLHDLLAFIIATNRSKNPAFYFKIFHLGRMINEQTSISQLIDSSDISLNLFTFMIDISHERDVSYFHKEGYFSTDFAGASKNFRVRSIKSNSYLPYVMEYVKVSKSYKKTFLGGYLDVTTSTIYHNATSQTKLTNHIQPGLPFLESRLTQTYNMKHLKISTLQENGTQTKRVGYHISNYFDKVLIPGKYETAEMFNNRLLASIIVIQKNFRRWKAIKYVKKIRNQKLEVDAWNLQSENMKDLILDNLKRRLLPSSSLGIETITSAIGEWKRNKTLEIYEKIDCNLEKKVAMSLLVEQEIKQMFDVSLQKIILSRRKKEFKPYSLLQKSSEPLKWISSSTGDSFQMESVPIRKSKEIFHIYKELISDNNTTERIDILQTLKNFLKNESGPGQSPLITEITEIINRELFWMSKKIRTKAFFGLRKRLASRFLTLVKMAEINPHVANFLPYVQGDNETAKKHLVEDLVYCFGCAQFKKLDKFPLSAKKISHLKCALCLKHADKASRRLNIPTFQQILRVLIDSEKKLVLEKHEEMEEKFSKNLKDRLDMCIGVKTAIGKSKLDLIEDEDIKNPPEYHMLVDEYDIHYIVAYIWQSRSVLTCYSDTKDLFLCRWIMNEPWSPWNSVLLTFEEMELHQKQARNLHPEEIYGDYVIKRVKYCNALGKLAYSRLDEIGKERCTRLGMNRNKLIDRIVELKTS